MKKISNQAIKNRKIWTNRIINLKGNFIKEVEEIEKDLHKEIEQYGGIAIINHLRLCGNIPELYTQDSTEEKLYSKYTDSILSLAYKQIGLVSTVLTERTDNADVEAVSKEYSFVADAKVFRLTRTAKNQKDFKIQAMNKWKYGKPYAMVVCPIYQLPNRSSQIYQQSSAVNVCIFTYSHLALLVNFSLKKDKKQARELLHEIFKTVQALNPSKNSVDYWLAINKSILNYSEDIHELWNEEKEAVIESIQIAKKETLDYLALQREKIMRMSRSEAIKHLLKNNNIENKIKIVKSLKDTNIFNLKQ